MMQVSYEYNEQSSKPNDSWQRAAICLDEVGNIWVKNIDETAY